MVHQKPKTKLTVEDYMATSDDERWELLDGELIMPPAPGTRHQRIQVNVGVRLAQFVEETGFGQVYFAPTDVVLSDTDVVQPDLLFIASERLNIVTPANIQGAPDLVVEILSPATADRDRGYKSELYARHGVKEYWMLGTDPDTVTVLLLQGSGYKAVQTVGPGETLESPTLQGFSISADDIFAP